MEKSKQMDNLIQVVQLANRKIAEGWARMNLPGEPPHIGLGAAEVILEAADELGLSYKDVKKG